MKPPSTKSISISCVIYDTDFSVIKATIKSLSSALHFAKENGYISSHSFYLINNYSHTNPSFEMACKYARELGLNCIIKSGHGNIGYGKGNNLAILNSQNTFHLVLNPDVIMEQDAIAQGIHFLEKNPEANLVAPSITNEKGEIEYLAKREPSTWIIFLRGFNNSYLNSLFKKSLDTYCYKDLIPAQHPIQIELASGCFMLCRGEDLRKAEGFSPQYFLYFEDFDLSRKLSRLGKLYHLPQMKIIHAGGNTARKGLKHIKMFLESYWVYRRLSKRID